MDEGLKTLFDYGALGAIVAVFLYYGIKMLNATIPQLLDELKTLNKTMKLILKSLVETLPRGAKQRLLDEYLQEFSEEKKKGGDKE
jgi:undecaprenyl pyrophosphate phosphatase UppP